MKHLDLGNDVSDDASETIKLQDEVWGMVTNWNYQKKSPYMIAAVLMTSAMSIYKSVLSEQEYHAVLKMIFDTKDEVQTIKFISPEKLN